MVIGLGLCPFAGQPVAKGRHHIAVLDVHSIDAALAALRIECENLMTVAPKKVETSLLILPYLFDDFLDFNDFMSEANNLLADYDWSSQLQLASFHPRYQFFGTDPEAASNLTNCSPYPIIHILREECDMGGKKSPRYMHYYRKEYGRYGGFVSGSNSSFISFSLSLF